MAQSAVPANDKTCSRNVLHGRNARVQLLASMMSCCHTSNCKEPKADTSTTHSTYPHVIKHNLYKNTR